MKLIILVLALNLIAIDSYNDFQFNADEMRMIAFQYNSVNIGLSNTDSIPEKYDLTKLSDEEIETNRDEILKFFTSSYYADTLMINQLTKKCECYFDVDIESRINPDNSKFCTLTNTFVDSKNVLCEDFYDPYNDYSSLKYYLFTNRGKLIRISFENEQEILQYINDYSNKYKYTTVYAKRLVKIFVNWRNMGHILVDCDFAKRLNIEGVHKPIVTEYEDHIFLSYCFYRHDVLEVNYFLYKTGEVKVETRTIEVSDY
jgi:hypothetical protein